MIGQYITPNPGHFVFPRCPAMTGFLFKQGVSLPTCGTSSVVSTTAMVCVVCSVMGSQRFILEASTVQYIRPVELAHSFNTGDASLDREPDTLRRRTRFEDYGNGVGDGTE